MVMAAMFPRRTCAHYLLAALLAVGTVGPSSGCRKQNHPPAKSPTVPAEVNKTPAAPVGVPDEMDTSAAVPAKVPTEMDTIPVGAHSIEIRRLSDGDQHVKVDGKTLMIDHPLGDIPDPLPLERHLRSLCEGMTASHAREPETLFFLVCDPEVTFDVLARVFIASTQAGLLPDPNYRRDGNLVCKLAGAEEIAAWAGHRPFFRMRGKTMLRRGLLPGNLPEDTEPDAAIVGAINAGFRVGLCSVEPSDETTKALADVLFKGEPMRDFAELSVRLKAEAENLRARGINPAEVPVSIVPDMLIQFRHVAAANKAMMDAGFKWIFVSVPQ